MIIFKTGNLFDSDAKILAHGTNTSGKMNSGIAVEFRNRYPDMHKQYLKLCKEQTSERLVGTAAIYVNDEDYIANVFSQDLPGPHAKYEWTRKGLNQVMNFAIQNDIPSIATCRIGSGVGGLDWNKMQVMIFDNFEKYPVDIELWSLPDAD